MADSLPSPPTSRASTPNLQKAQVASDDLSTQLDRLLEQYLELLDQYSTLRAELSKSFSSGFFSLANAQRTASLGAGRRYGQEGYDGRMKALRRLEIEAEEGPQTNTQIEVTVEDDSTDFKGRYTFTMIKYNSGDQPGNRSSIVKDATSKAHATGNGKEKVSELDTERSLPPEDKAQPAYRDPASWFGLLIPQHLRQTQNFFITAIETTVPSMVNTASSMRVLEQEIWKVRVALGIEKQYPEELTTGDNLVPDNVQEVDILLAKAKLSANHR